MCFTLNIMHAWRAETKTVHLAPRYQGTHCQSSAMRFVFTQYSFCNSFRHGLLDRLKQTKITLLSGNHLKKISCIWETLNLLTNAVSTSNGICIFSFLFAQKVSTKSLHKKSPQKVYTKNIHKKFLQKVSKKSIHKKCPQKVSTKRIHKKGSTKRVYQKWPQKVSTKSVTCH